ncbi:hypothetical protein [Chitinophaga japonensis]|uniref:Outer membrane protein n=1 Tax=Chitinophaga japonensis TaxID=104662 RepID=A0A562TCY1_CHIJA|nr:hypothetical protein [Chitinophaga japonensis]TWI90936.1 hypothetical protein LX66_0297 [Chitinophaga japonensis]
MKYILTFFLAGVSALPAFSQSDSTTADKKKTTFTIGATYTNNANYYGQKAAESMPYLAASAALRFRSGIYFTAAGYRLLNDSGTFASASSAGAGIVFNLGKKLTADLGYSHTFYPSHSPFLQAANPDNASASLKYEYWMSTALDVDYNFGRQQDVFVTIGTEKLISLGSIFKGKDIVTLTPSIAVTGGTQRFYQTYVTEKLLRDSILGVPLPDIGGIAGMENGSAASTTKFNLLSYNLRVPLAYNRAHYMLEAACQLSLLGPRAETGAGKLNSFLDFSFYYQF